MSNVLLRVVFFLVLVCCKTQNVKPVQGGVRLSAQAPVLPQPQNFTTGLRIAQVCSLFTFRTSQRSRVLLDAFYRYKKLIFSHFSRQKLMSNCVKGLTVRVDNITTDSTYPSLEDDESYVLHIPLSGWVMLRAVTVFGALRGVETFSQLVHFNFTHKLYQVAKAPWDIRDFPRFQHRGLLIDTARHFQPVANIKRILDSMSYAKLNVMHWHIVDTQSFPMEVKLYPNMWEGSFSYWERYTQEDIYDIVEYARLRGIRIIPEFDIPGHAASWCAGYSDLCPSSSCTQPLNPAHNITFEIIEDIVKEVAGKTDAAALFPDGFIHLGGDEVKTSCWETSPAVRKWMRENGIFLFQDVYRHFVEYGHKVSEAVRRTVINWEEAFTNFGTEMNKNTVIQIWIREESIPYVVCSGFRCIDSYENHWYLDWRGTSWKTFYNHDPHKLVDNVDLQKLVIGGEVCAWGEHIDGSNLDLTIWPRAAAAAERLWSSRDVNNVTMMKPRLASFRCLLHRRGISSSPLQSGTRKEPSGPGGCDVQ